MRLSEEYCLSEYQELGSLNGNEKVHIVRNRINGLICVRKHLTPELLDIYTFLKNHPNPYIPKIYECICEGHELIVIEEYFTGKNLEEVLREREFSFGEAGRILVDLCRGLRPLHEAEPPIICRDLKTENVILTNEGDVKLIDFDIARIYQPGKVKDTVMMGTEGYAAPEQFGFGQTDGYLWNGCVAQLSAYTYVPVRKNGCGADGTDYPEMYKIKPGGQISIGG